MTSTILQSFKKFCWFKRILQTKTKKCVLVCKLPLWHHRNLKLCKNVSYHNNNMYVKFRWNSNNSFWVIKIFLLLGSVLFWSEKCISIRKKKWKPCLFCFPVNDLSKNVQELFQTKKSHGIVFLWQFSLHYDQFLSTISFTLNF